MQYNFITKVFFLLIIFLFLLNFSFADESCVTCSSLSSIIKVSDFTSSVVDGKIVLDFNVLCDKNSLWVDKNISIYSVVVKKNDSLISSTFSPILNCGKINYERKITINECEKANYSVSFVYGINEPNCSIANNCQGLVKFYSSQSCDPNYVNNPNADQINIPDNNFVSLIFVFILVLFIVLKNKNFNKN
ncbi:MAG TPA: hypothetical protein PKK60_01850 [archaeon]|nr:hypothetical protein [archaeon]